MKRTRIVLTLPRPRNPVATEARARQAGAHTRSRSGLRQAGARALRHELADLHPPTRR